MLVSCISPLMTMRHEIDFLGSRNGILESLKEYFSVGKSIEQSGSQGLFPYSSLSENSDNKFENTDIRQDSDDPFTYYVTLLGGRGV